jgi:hypothetical protein
VTPRLQASPNEALTVSEALTRHYHAHGLPPDGGEGSPWFRVRLGPLSIRLPNPPARRRAVFFHDVNHLLTGYNTAFSDGEVAIAAFEVGTGCGPYWIAWYINLTMLALGLVLAPRAVYRGFVRGRRASSIYRRGEDRPTLASLEVAELKEQLGIDRSPAPISAAERFRFAGWALLASVVLLGPILVLTLGLRAVLAILAR